MEWVHTTRYLGVTLEFTPDLVASYPTGEEESLPETLLNGRRDLSIRNCVLLYKFSSLNDGLCMTNVEVCRSQLCQAAAGSPAQLFLHCYWCTVVH
jgi:hypothetical protein